MIAITVETGLSVGHDTLVCFVPQGHDAYAAISEIVSCNEAVRVAVADFRGDKGEKRLVYLSDSPVAKKVVFVGTGDKQKTTIADFRDIVGGLCKYATGEKISSLACYVAESLSKELSPATVAFTIAEVMPLAAYEYKKYKTKTDETAVVLRGVVIVLADKKLKSVVEKDVHAADTISKAVCNARDLINGPANDVTPEYVATYLRAEAEKRAVSCDVLGIGEITKEKMGGLLAVSQGSTHAPRFVVLRYKGKGKTKKTICLVGKGVCFDSGGLSLKPSAGMVRMKYDMAGASVCAHAVFAAADLAIDHEVIGLFPLCENMPSASAYRPGDVITAMSGATIEVLNTDAEGRLILADALHYAGRFKPDVVIDMATLTGAAKICLGSKAAAVLGNDKHVVNGLEKAGYATGERVWHLPLWDDYKEDLKSSIADIKNIGSKGAGTIVAAQFLAHFVPEDVAWAHIDVAAVAWEDDGKSFVPQGPSGFGVRLLAYYLLSV